MALPEVWYGTQAWVSFEEEGADPKNLTFKIKSLEIGGGTRDTEDIYTFGNHTIQKEKRAEQLEIRITGLSTDTTWRYMWAGGTEDTTSPYRVSGLASTRDKWRIILLLKDGVTQSDFEDELNINYGKGSIAGPCYRAAFYDAYAVEVSESLDADGAFEVEITFKCSAENFIIDVSDDSGTTIPALTDY